jgi:signal transduction histidine kinase/CheY-like chemotaxis protein
VTRPDPVAGADPGRPAAAAAAAEIEHMRALFEQTPATLAGNLLGLLVLSASFLPLAAPLPAWGWSCTVGLLWLVRLAHYLRWRRQPDAGAGLLRRWRTSWRVLVLLQGAMWGLAGWLFWSYGTPYHRVALLLVVYSYCMGSVQLLASQPRLFLGFIGLVLTPTIVRVASDDSLPWHLPLAGILTLLFFMSVLMARTFRNALGQAVWLKVRTDELAAQLRTEMAATEQARRAAEAASRAKTQFFAAASHDLRQPLHALGLFAEALRQRSRDPEVAGLIDSINESVDALEGLFSELLDLTRIDSGGVEVHPQAVPLKDLFARLRLHFEPLAFEKGLMLSLRGSRHVVHGDPVLIERVLRNLVSNAIRYTEDGGVLVCCRPRAGRMLLQVWDSGIGIPDGALPHIFDEFYQVGGARTPQPHDRKGLGLGLAIVKRLAALMDAPLGVRSRLGHGSVFTLELPPGQLARDPGAPAAGARRPGALSLQGLRLVVVEDEPAVREGLSVLLQAWGAQVDAFDSLAALDAWLPSAPVPDLLLVDHRLPDGRTGLEALVALRAAFPDRHLPAIVITGSTLVGHEDEAARYDYHLLIKPVLPNRLRAMIAFKLRGAGRDPAPH